MNRLGFSDINGCMKGRCVYEPEGSEAVLRPGCKISPTLAGALSPHGGCLSAPQHCSYPEDRWLCWRLWCQYGLCWAMDSSVLGTIIASRETPIPCASWNAPRTICVPRACLALPVPCSLPSILTENCRLGYSPSDATGCPLVPRTLSAYVANDN